MSFSAGRSVVSMYVTDRMLSDRMPLPGCPATKSAAADLASSRLNISPLVVGSGVGVERPSVDAGCGWDLLQPGAKQSEPSRIRVSAVQVRIIVDPWPFARTACNCMARPESRGQRNQAGARQRAVG